MITRFRARLHSLHALTKLDPQAQAEKTAQTGKKHLKNIYIFTMCLPLNI